MHRNGTLKKYSKIFADDLNSGERLSDSDLFGYSISWLSDLNGDGIPDLAIGAPGFNNNGLRIFLKILYRRKDQSG